MWIISHDEFLLNLDHAALVMYRSLKSGQHEVYVAMTHEIDGDDEAHIAVTETEDEARAIMLDIAKKLDAIDPDRSK